MDVYICILKSLYIDYKVLFNITFGKGDGMF